MPRKLDNGLRVTLGGREVGTLAETPEGLVAFQYDADWLLDGFSINPYSLPLENSLFIPKWEPFGGLFGVFNDSLPDGWGALLLDRMLKGAGIDPQTTMPIERLSIVGSRGRGALEYKPQAEFQVRSKQRTLDELAALFDGILKDEAVNDLDEAYAAAGSSGGARPKAYITDNGEEWLVKFPATIDPEDIGELEYDYMACAEACGIRVPEYRLFESRHCSGYFGTRRFDVNGEGGRLHMLSASGAVEVSHREPILDYRNLFQMTYLLTQSREQAEQLFRLACFNVFARNHDDHANNFSWLYDGQAWQLAPAYDLTYSEGFHRGHMTSVIGNHNPTMQDLLDLAKEAGISSGASKRIASEIRDACAELLVRHKLA